LPPKCMILAINQEFVHELSIKTNRDMKIISE